MIKTTLLSILSTVLITVISSAAWAQDLNCQISYNLEVILKTKVTSISEQKVGIGKSSIVTAYVTAKANNLYAIEAYLPEYEVRIYGQGALTQDSDMVSASLWGRDSMIDVNCKLVK